MPEGYVSAWMYGGEWCQVLHSWHIDHNALNDRMLTILLPTGEEATINAGFCAMTSTIPAEWLKITK
jgi:hypothetical protein